MKRMRKKELIDLLLECEYPVEQMPYSDKREEVLKKIRSLRGWDGKH